MEFFKFFSKNKKSKDVAKERLKLVLIQDRNKVSPIIIENIKKDIIEAVSKYAEVDDAEVDIKISRSKRDSDSKPTSALVVDIPIIRIKEKDIEE